MEKHLNLKPLQVVLARPRGFCAGVERAIKTVEKALEYYGAPVYVLKHIVHNAHVVDELRAKGALFVKEISDVPPGSHLLFSAHGVPPACRKEAQERGLHVIDATCPLVAKVHREITTFAEQGYTILYIGDAGHDETLGAIGCAPNHIRVIRTEADVAALTVENPTTLAYLTQTTLSVSDCDHIVRALRLRFPHIVGPKKPDICYATSNRQMAITKLAPEADLVLVVGDPESANSCRLRDMALQLGKPSFLIQDASCLNKEWFDSVTTLLLTSGASAPERLVEEVIAQMHDWFLCTVRECVLAEETIHFNLPPECTGS